MNLDVSRITVELLKAGSERADLDPIRFTYHFQDRTFTVMIPGYAADDFQQRLHCAEAELRAQVDLEFPSRA